MFIDHVVEAGIEDARVLDHAVDQGAEIEIAGAHIVEAAAVRVLTVRAHVENPVLAASLQIGKKTVAPNQGKFYDNRWNLIYPYHYTFALRNSVIMLVVSSIIYIHITWFFFHVGTEVIEPYTSTTVNWCTCCECRIIVSWEQKGILLPSISRATLSHVHISSVTYILIMTTHHLGYQKKRKMNPILILM